MLALPSRLRASCKIREEVASSKALGLAKAIVQRFGFGLFSLGKGRSTSLVLRVSGEKINDIIIINQNTLIQIAWLDFHSLSARLPH